LILELLIILGLLSEASKFFSIDFVFSLFPLINLVGAGFVLIYILKPCCKWLQEKTNKKEGTK
jgi:hypothetical protein